MNGNIKDYLIINKEKNIAKVFSFDDFKIFFQQEGITSDDLVILKFSAKTYNIAIPKISKAQIIINNQDKKFKKNEQYFIETLTSNFHNLKNKERNFFSFLYSEIKDRYIFLIIIICISIFLPFIFSKGLIEFSKGIISLVFPLIGVYFALMVLFLSSTTLNFNQQMFLSGKISEYFSNDRNIAYLGIYTMFYILILYSLILLGGKNGYNIVWNNIFIERYLLSLSIGIMIYLVFINFGNLIEYHMLNQQNFKLGKMKDEFFKSLTKE